MDELDNTSPQLPLFIHFKEAAGFIKKLELSGNENAWMNALEKLESKMGFNGIEILHALKLMVMSCRSLTALKNLMCIFLRKVTMLMDELKLLTDKQKSQETWKVVQTFWSLCANQHAQLSGKVNGYSGEFYEILPSLASVYIDLFIAANRCKKKVRILSKKLYGWLKFELNERCMKTALLEVSERTPQGAKILSPILKKLLSQPIFQNSDDGNLDYLLHFVLLKSWLTVCDDLKEIAEACLRISAPKTFVEWLKDNWSQSAEHLPDDKSFKRRRVSELLIEVDEKTTEELIDVFSNCLWAICGAKEGPTTQQDTSNLFVIDKKGEESQKISPDSKKSRKRKRNIKDSSQILDDDTSLQTDCFLLTDPSSSNRSSAKRRKIMTDEGNIDIAGAGKQKEELMEQSVDFYLDRNSANKLQDTGVCEVMKSADRTLKVEIEQKNKTESSCGITISSESEMEIISQDTGAGESEKSHPESQSGFTISSESEMEIILPDTGVVESVKSAEKIQIIDVDQKNNAESSGGVTISSESDIEIIEENLKVSTSIKKPKADVNKMKTVSPMKKVLEKKEAIEIIADHVLEPSPKKMKTVSPMKKVLEKKEAIEIISDHVLEPSPKKMKTVSPMKKVLEKKEAIEIIADHVLEPSPTKMKTVSPMKKVLEKKEVIEIIADHVLEPSPTKIKTASPKKKVLEKKEVIEIIADHVLEPSPTKMKTASPKKKVLEKKEVIEIITDQVLEPSPTKMETPVSLKNKVLENKEAVEIIADHVSPPTKMRHTVASPLKNKHNHTSNHYNDIGEFINIDEQILNDLIALSKEQEVITVRLTGEKDEMIGLSHSGNSTIERQIDLMLTQIRTSVKTIEEQPLTSIKSRLGRKSDTSTLSEEKEIEDRQKFLSDWLIKPNVNSNQHKTAHKCVEKPDGITKLTTDSIRQSPRNKSVKGITSAETNNAATVKANVGRVSQHKSPEVSNHGDAVEESCISPSQGTPKNKRNTLVSSGSKKSNKEQTVDENSNSNLDDIEILHTTPKKTEKTPTKKNNSVISKSGKKGKPNSESRSPSQESPLKRSYFLRKKNVDGTPTKCACLQDDSCSLHNKGFDSPRSGKLLRARRSDINSGQSTPTGKRKPTTPKI